MVRGIPDHPVDEGMLCQKRLHQAEVLNADGRVTDPR